MRATFPRLRLLISPPCEKRIRIKIEIDPSTKTRFLRDRQRLLKPFSSIALFHLSINQEYLRLDIGYDYVIKDKEEDFFVHLKNEVAVDSFSAATN